MVRIDVDARPACMRWWDERFPSAKGGGGGVPFSSVFLPALLQATRHELPPLDGLSLEEVGVIVKYCVTAGNASPRDFITPQEFVHFVARFGPLESSVRKLLECFMAHRELVTWFHGTLSRAEAERVLLSPSSPSVRTSVDDGAFLVRFSESQPTRFTLSYVKVHSSGPHAGRREMKNVLIENIGAEGYVLCDSKTKTYSSIRSFIQQSSGRLKHGIASVLSRRCNQELAEVRSRRDMASNSYTSFSTDSLDPALSPSFRPQPNPNLLFSKSPEQPLMSNGGNNQAEHNQLDASDDYMSFATDAVLPPLLTVRTAERRPPQASDDYASFSGSSVIPQDNQRSTVAHRGQTSNVRNEDADYGDFSALSGQIKSTPASTMQDEYSSFENITVQLANRSRLPPATLSSDAYGTFEGFALESESSRQYQDDGGYGNFMTFSSSDDTPSMTAPSPSQLFQQPSSSDVYGTFMSSPTLSTIPAPSVVGISQSTPTLSSDTYGSFSSVTVSAPSSPSLRVGPHSTPANVGSKVKVVDEDRQLSPLDALEAGMLFYKQKQLDNALLRFIRARELAQQHDDKVVEARALGNLGTVYLDKQNPEQAVKCYQQCLEITRSIKDVKRERTILNNLILALMASEDFNTAYRYCEIQLDQTANEINRRKILSRMSLLRERAARAAREANARRN